LARRRESITAPNVGFDPRLGGTGRYVNLATGKIIKQPVELDALEAQIDKSRGNIERIGRQLANSEISLADWQLQTRTQMKLIHTQSAALAKGGWAQMSQADWGAVGRISRDEYMRLEKVAVSISKGDIKLRRLDGEINGQFLRISDQFGQAGYSTYEQIERRTANQNGLTEERRVLDPGAQHCDCCIGQADRWVPVGTLKPIGACTCVHNCRCEFEFR
jgi:hypothetical protein